MKHTEIIETFDEIKNLIMKGKTDLAIEKAEQFISNLDDNILEDQIISISSRYNRFIREKIQGVISDENNKELNSIDAHLVNLLREAKQIAIEKASLEVGSQLSELAHEGTSAIEELKKLNIIIAESRLVELQVIKSMFGNIFTSSDNEKFEQNIDALKKVLNKEEDENNNDENSASNFFIKLTEQFEKNIPENKPSFEEIMELMNKVKDKMLLDMANKPDSMMQNKK